MLRYVFICRSKDLLVSNEKSKYLWYTGYRAFAIALAFLSVESIAGQQVYRYVDENGVVSFSSQPPAGTADVKRIEIQTTNTLESPEGFERREKIEQTYENVTSRIRDRQEKRKTRARMILEAEREVEARRKALEQGKEPRPGERIGTVYGYSRLRPIYHERIKGLEEALSVAEEKLRNLKRQR